MNKHKLLALIADMHTIVSAMPSEGLEQRKASRIRQPRMRDPAYSADLSEHPWEPKILAFMANRPDDMRTKTKDVLTHLGVAEERQNHGHKIIVRRILEAWNYRYMSKKIGSQTLASWAKLKIQSKLFQPEPERVLADREFECYLRKGGMDEDTVEQVMAHRKATKEVA
jgi:hypothetical protein